MRHIRSVEQQNALSKDNPETGLNYTHLPKN